MIRDTNFQPGDRVLSDLDGQIYEVVKYGSREIVDPLPGVRVTGNAMIVQDSKGATQMLYDWEVTKIVQRASDGTI